MLTERGISVYRVSNLVGHLRNHGEVENDEDALVIDVVTDEILDANERQRLEMAIGDEVGELRGGDGLHEVDAIAETEAIARGVTVGGVGRRDGLEVDHLQQRLARGLPGAVNLGDGAVRLVAGNVEESGAASVRSRLPSAFSRGGGAVPPAALLFAYAVRPLRAWSAALASMAESFLPLPVQKKTPRVQLANPRQLTKWKHVQKVAAHRYDQAVTHVQFSPRKPYELAVAHDFSISLINPLDGYTRKSLTTFRDVAYSPDYKKDGRLLVAGCADGSAKVFDVAHRTVLRNFKAHQGSVRTTKFSADGLRVLTGSDDHTVRVWDLATATSLFVLEEATDYVQAQASSPASMHVWMTGSADRKARLYDLRTKECIFELEHSSAITDVHILPGGARAITIGGNEMRVWDFFVGGRVVYNLQPHSKGIMCGVSDVLGNRFLTGGLDGYVKVHDLSNFQSQGLMSFRSPILSVDLCSEGKRYAAGMADGKLEIRAHTKLKARRHAPFRQDPFKDREFEGWGRGFERIGGDRAAPRPGTQRYFDRGRNAKPSNEDILITYLPRPKLAKYDMSLKSFNFGEALDLAVETKKPQVVVCVVEELIIRGCLKGALSDRTVENLTPLLLMIRKHIRTPPYTEYLSYLTHAILDLYSSEFKGEGRVDNLMNDIFKQLRFEVQACHKLTVLKGSVEAILGTMKYSA
ncbi:U3 small nucleolar RNA-associated protein [Gracilaria domingensis]|nr:U3 small nucleolar RNA-associated protein [Gracilaria domingensis]